ncbi:Toluene efflux pump periplasmic linker protein TtgG precursor [Roseivivax jejudonensis]|uniref:Toluene efflux pump periplasmic linker protein TtgG n=1 Tax=Roseivivax jejudonensis TaxID=1529041 RepID=A0A1X6YWV5_9RHOB|nr:efflux RND transporter periplasmic adaptor subunit [Roseivivax jejudonensis]SLN33980.1 Toluene efflux pump periplasmic linker protein TtgG precursor [Roseivivax jejudonensis]
MTESEPQSRRSEPLEFETDRGASRSIWVAMALLVAIVLWMGSGFVLPQGDAGQPEQAEAPEPQPPAVRVRASEAEPVTLTFGAEGQALPDRDTEVRAEASGNVIELPVAKGDEVEEGATLARLSSTEAEAALRQAEEERTRAQREFDNAQSLLERGVATVDRVAEARATLAAAESGVTAAERALEDLTIAAPFAGRVERLDIDTGEYVAAGDVVARVVDTRPLTVAIQVPQQALNRIEVGQSAQVRFITGQERAGEVTFVGSAAASETRTFLAEIEVENEDGAIPAGVSAEVTIPTGDVTAHFVPASIVSLDPEGEIGVKTVEDGRVRFHPISVARAEIGGVWVRGLPESAEIITVGQGFVRDGEVVRAQPEEGDAATSAGEADAGAAAAAATAGVEDDQ